MIIKTKGIVLRSTKYSETSLILDVFTEAKGLCTYIVSGVRTPKARVKAGMLQVMSMLDMVVYHRTDKDIARTKEIKPAYLYQSIPFDITKSAVGLFMVELAQKTIKEKEQNQRIFDFLIDSFQYLDQTEESVANIPLIFMLELTTHLGLMPSGVASGDYPYFDMKEGVFIAEQNTSAHTLGVELSTALTQLLQSSKTTCHSVFINRHIRKALLEKMIDYYRLHVENFNGLNAHTILQEVLSD